MFFVLKPRVISGCSVAPLRKCRLLRSSLIITAVTNSHQCQSSITHPSELTSDSSEPVSFNSTFCNRWSVNTDKYNKDKNTNRNGVHEHYTMEKQGAVVSNVDKSYSEEKCEDKNERRSTLLSPSSSSLESTSMPLSPEFSYRYLLERGAFASVMQLVHSPFAPSPLRVYRDLLQILQETIMESHTERLSLASSSPEVADKKYLPKVQDNYITPEQRTREKNDNGTEICQELKDNEEGLKLGNEVIQYSEKKSNDNTVHVINTRELQVMSFARWQTTRQRVISALSAPGEISQLMRIAYDEVQTSMNELKEMNDVESIERAREKVSELCSFMEYLQGVMSSKVSENENASTFMVSHSNGANSKTIISAKEKTAEQLLPNSVYAETLHYLLEMCSITGLHLLAVQALDELIQLNERVQISQEMADHTSKSNATSENNIVDNRNKLNNETIRVFSIDKIVERVQYNISKQVRTVSAHDHIAAMESCALHKDFMTALSLYRRFIVHATEGRFPLQSADLERAMVALCHCVKCNSEFDTLRELMLHEEAASTLPVSVTLYTALLEALCNLPRHAHQRTIALALYRRLRDGFLPLNVHSYAALIGCSVGAYETSNEHCLIRAQELTCTPPTNGNDSAIFSSLHKRDNNNTRVEEKTSASLTPVHGQDNNTTAIAAEYRDPLQSFAFYHEARSCCNISDFTAELYTNLLKAYVHGGYGNDAKQTLSVLIESGAPLSLSSFHTLLSSSSITLRDGQEMVECMTRQYKLCPTPITYGWLVLATIRQLMRPEASPKLNNINYILQLFDFHEEAVQCFATLHPAALHDDTQTLLLSSKVTGAEQTVDNKHESNKKIIEKDFINASINNNTNDNSIQRVYACMSTPASQDAVLIATYPFYVLSVQNALMHVKSEIYSVQNKLRITPYLLPLIRIAQMQMNAFTSMPPQMPTKLSLHYKQQASTSSYNVSINDNKNTTHVSNISSGDSNSSRESNLCVAVLAADALLSLEECVLPFIRFYSAIFIPFSTLLTYQYAIMVNDVMMESNNPDYHMSRWLDVETHALSANGSHYIDESLYDMSKLHTLRHFLHQYKEVIHIGSIDEELELNRVANRYGVSIRDEVESSFGKVAVAAIHLARKDVLLMSEEPEEELNEEELQEELRENNSDKYQECFKKSSNSNKLSSLCTLYAEHNVNIIAVSNRFQECGRYIVKLKKEYVKRKSYTNKKRGYTSYNDNDDETFYGLRDALQHVYYHNPSVYPNWTPPSLNVRKITSQQTETEHEEQIQQEQHQRCETSDEKKSKTCTDDEGNVNVENVIDTIGSKEAETMYKALMANSNNIDSRERSQIKVSNECSSEIQHAGNNAYEYCDQDVLDPEMVSRMMCDE